ncbi:MAG: ferredoxin, partial [Campylobacterota bacterium]
SSQQEFFDSLDLGYLSGESNIALEEIDLLKHFSKRKKALTIIIGEDVINHPESVNIARIVGLLQKSSEFKVLIIPPQTNTLGVSQICELDEASEGLSVGYNVKADFTLSAKGSGDLDMPALNQQEGTFVNIDKDLVSLNAGVKYSGYELNDIACALGLEKENVIEYTSELGFGEITFDELPNSIDPSGKITRGIKIESKSNTQNALVEDVEDLDEFNGTVVYSCNPLDQFNVFTENCKQIVEKKSAGNYELIASKQFATAANLKPGSVVKFTIDGEEFIRKLKVDKNMTGTVAFNPNFDLDTVSSEYRYNQVKLKVENE